MPWQAEHWSAFGAVAGAIATSVGAGIVWYQISTASAALQAANSYMVRKDLIEAATAASQALIQSGSQHDDNAAWEPQLRRYDSLVRAVSAMKNNGALSDLTWHSILKDVCLPSFAKVNYRVGRVELNSMRDVCQRYLGENAGLAQ